MNPLIQLPNSVSVSYMRRMASNLSALSLAAGPLSNTWISVPLCIVGCVVQVTLHVLFVSSTSTVKSVMRSTPELTSFCKSSSNRIELIRTFSNGPRSTSIFPLTTVAFPRPSSLSTSFQTWLMQSSVTTILLLLLILIVCVCSVILLYASALSAILVLTNSSSRSNTESILGHSSNTAWVSLRSMASCTECLSLAISSKRASLSFGS